MSASDEKPGDPAPAISGRRRVTKIGIVTSNKMQKTVVVTVETLKAHKTYGRTLRRSRKFMAHDPNGACGPGDKVVIAESRPLSANKRWRVVEVIEKARTAATAAAAARGEAGS